MASKPQNWSETAGWTGPSLDTGSWLVARCKDLWRALEYSSGYLALLAVLEVLVVRYLLGLPPSPAPYVVGLVTFAIYANDRLVDLESDEVSNPARTAFVRRHRQVLYVFAAVAYGLAVALSVLGGPLVFALALLPGVAWVLYAVEWVPDVTAPFGRLKQVFLVNSAVVAGVYSLAVVFLPVTYGSGAFSPVVVVLFLYFALGTFVDVEVSNAFDIESDIESGVSTLPVVFGVARTRQVLYGVVLLAGGVLGYATVGGHLSATAAGALGVGLVYLFGVVSLLGRVEGETSLPLLAEFSRLPVFLALILPVLAI